MKHPAFHSPRPFFPSRPFDWTQAAQAPGTIRHRHGEPIPTRGAEPEAGRGLKASLLPAEIRSKRNGVAARLRVSTRCARVNANGKWGQGALGARGAGLHDRGGSHSGGEFCQQRAGGREKWKGNKCIPVLEEEGGCFGVKGCCVNVQGQMDNSIRL